MRVVNSGEGESKASVLRIRVTRYGGVMLQLDGELKGDQIKTALQALGCLVEKAGGGGGLEGIPPLENCR